MMKIRVGILAIGIGLILSVAALAQEATGGYQSIFSMGVGARQLGMGGASVAFPIDATTVYWNPAGMEEIQRANLAAFYATLFLGTSYNFVGFVYPTLNIGTFGLGVSRIATGGIVRRDFHYVDLGTFSYDQEEFYLSYAKEIRNLFNAGASVKVERQVIGLDSGVGFGVDLALFYRPDFGSVYLKNTKIGLIYQNAYAPRIKLRQSIDYMPSMLRVGVARSFYFTNTLSPFVISMDIQKGDQMPFRLNFGAEYTYNGQAMIRLGANNRGLTFGAGAVYKQFQVDYAYGRVDSRGVLGGSHRLSLVVNFGKSRAEKLEFLAAQRQKEIEEQIARENARRREAQIKKLLQEGQDLFSSGQYFQALVKFQQVLELDKANPEALDMVDETKARMDEIREKEMQQELSKIQVERQRKDVEAYVEAHVNKGLDYMKQGDYVKAINEWNLALQRQPNSEQIKGYITNARKELLNRINKMIAKADELARKGKYGEADQLLRQALLLSENDAARQEEIRKRIAQLETQLNVYDYYQQGLVAYRSENWKEAMINFEKALKLNPKDPKIRAYYQDAERHALARDQKMTPEMLEKFNTGVKLYVDDRLEEAIKVWEDLLKEQPYNKKIIDAIDSAKKQLKERRKAHSK